VEVSVGEYKARDILVSPSAAFYNGNIADGRLKWRYPFRKLRISRNLQRNRIRVVQIEAVGYQIWSINCGKASLLQRILED